MTFMTTLRSQKFLQEGANETKISRTWIEMISICSTIWKIEIVSSQVLQSPNAPPICTIVLHCIAFRCKSKCLQMRHRLKGTRCFTTFSISPNLVRVTILRNFFFSNSCSLKLENEEVVSTSTTWGPPSVTTSKSGTGLRVSFSQDLRSVGVCHT